MVELGLEVEASRKSVVWMFSSKTRVRVGQICRDCESKSSRILLMVDLQVVDISGFDVIFDMDELTAHRVFSNCDLGKVIAYTPKVI